MSTKFDIDLLRGIREDDQIPLRDEDYDKKTRRMLRGEPFYASDMPNWNIVDKRK